MAEPERWSSPQCRAAPGPGDVWWGKREAAPSFVLPSIDDAERRPQIGTPAYPGLPGDRANTPHCQRGKQFLWYSFPGSVEMLRTRYFSSSGQPSFRNREQPRKR
ncbi:hypothetical protein GCM10009610_19310 [Pseudonocardia xinjiangensis]